MDYRNKTPTKGGLTYLPCLNFLWDDVVEDHATEWVGWWAITQQIRAMFWPQGSSSVTKLFLWLPKTLKAKMSHWFVLLCYSTTYPFCSSEINIAIYYQQHTTNSTAQYTPHTKGTYISFTLYVPVAHCTSSDASCAAWRVRCLIKHLLHAKLGSGTWLHHCTCIMHHDCAIRTRNCETTAPVQQHTLPRSPTPQCTTYVPNNVLGSAPHWTATFIHTTSTPKQLVQFAPDTHAHLLGLAPEGQRAQDHCIVDPVEPAVLAREEGDTHRVVHNTWKVPHSRPQLSNGHTGCVPDKI